MLLIHGDILKRSEPDPDSTPVPPGDPAAMRESALAFQQHPQRHTFEMAAQWMTEVSPEDVLALLDRLDRLESTQEFPLR